MYHCAVCNLAVIVLNGTVYRVCPVACANAPILATASASLKGQASAGIR